MKPSPHHFVLELHQLITHINDRSNSNPSLAVDPLINDDPARTQTKSDDITTTLTSVACIHSFCRTTAAVSYLNAT